MLLNNTNLIEVNAGIIAQGANGGQFIQSFIVRGLSLSSIDETEKEHAKFSLYDSKYTITIINFQL